MATFSALYIQLAIDVESFDLNLQTWHSLRQKYNVWSRSIWVFLLLSRFSCHSFYSKLKFICTCDNELSCRGTKEKVKRQQYILISMIHQLSNINLSRDQAKYVFDQTTSSTHDIYCCNLLITLAFTFDIRLFCVLAL